MRRGIICLSFSIFFLFIFSFQAARAAEPTTIEDNTHIKSATIWEKSKSPYLIKGYVYVEAELTIEPGTVVKFEYKKGGMEVWNKLTAIGSAADPIIFTSSRDDFFGGDTDGDSGANQPAKGDWLHINFGSTNASGEMKYVLVLYGGGLSYTDAAIVINGNDDVVLKKSSVKKSSSRGIMLVSSMPTIEENIISENAEGIYSSGQIKIPIIRNNSIFGNTILGASVEMPNGQSSTGRLDARNNWWGADSGPHYHSSFGWPDNREGGGNKILDGVIFDPWLKKDPVSGLDPVIVIPGIMGSWKKDGAWTIDPIFHTYDNLCEELLANGYEDGENFSVFPYEWRDSNIDNAKLLHNRIAEIKSQTGRPKVDIVAHSMGGLLAREYIESDYFDNDVDQLITIGTPHLGAPKDYVTWEAGEFLGYLSPVFKQIFSQEAKENNYSDIFSYIQKRPMHSVQELLPVYNYLFDDNGSDYILRLSYPLNYPKNQFLENLNDTNNMLSLRDLEFTKIIGKSSGSTTTISGYNVVNAEMGQLWQDGYPHGFEIPLIGDQGIRRDDGDRTVPLYSAEASNIPADKTITLRSEHNALPTDAQKDILEILTGKRPASEVRKWHVPNLLLITVHSPVDIQVESPSGLKVGKNFETNETYDQIEGAYYTGFDTKSEFITIPNPENGKYKIFAEGTGNGEYKIDTTKITENESDPDNAKTALAEVMGTAEPGKIKDVEIEITADQVIYNPDTTPPVIVINSPEEKTYLNNTYSLNFSVDIKDEDSGIDDLSVEKLLNGQLFTDSRLDLSLLGLSEQIIQVSAKDRAGNSGSAERKFKITTSLEAVQSNFNHYFSLGYVKDGYSKKYFEIQLAYLRNVSGFIEAVKNSNLFPFQKQITLNVLKKSSNAKIDFLIRQLNQNYLHWIDEKVAKLLIEDLNFIRP
jgi:parallel beta-helix repeat protein